MSEWSQIARRIRVPLGFVLAILYLWWARPAWYSLVAGGVVAALGLLLRALASGHVRKNAELTTSGPYAYTRNPLYLGSMIIAVGFALAARSLWVVAAMLVFFVLVYVPVVHAEERYLRSRFSGYDDYARRVPRFGFRLRPAEAARTQFSSALYLQHREYNALLGTALMMAALIAKLLWLR